MKHRTVRRYCYNGKVLEQEQSSDIENCTSGSVHNFQILSRSPVRNRATVPHETLIIICFSISRYSSSPAMDSKYDVKRAGLPKFNGFNGKSFKPLNLNKKSLKSKLSQQLKTNTQKETNGNGTVLAKPKVALLKNPFTVPVPKTALIEETNKKSLFQQRKLLPVYKFRNRIIQEILNNECLVLLGETGSGKTTQIPQFIYECGQILKGPAVCAVTQPRRMAAISIAQRVAEEQQKKLGDLVG